MQGTGANAGAALVEHIQEQLQLLAEGFARCLLVVEGSQGFLAQAWARAEALYATAERMGISLRLLTSSGPARTEVPPSSF